MQQSILVIDHDITSLKRAIPVLEASYKVTLISSSFDALEFLKHSTPDLILLDITMPDINGYELLTFIKENPDTDSIPVIFLADASNSQAEARGFEMGAVDFISKPIVIQSMKSRVSMHLELSHYHKYLKAIISEKTEMVETLQDFLVLGLCELVECRDNETGTHVLHTVNYTKALIEDLRANSKYAPLLTDSYVKDLIRSTPLHDIGKVGIPDNILLKPGKLNDEEFEYMKKHTILGAETIYRTTKRFPCISFLNMAAEVALTHHEKWDGTGYPHQLKEEKIPLCGRIMAISDVYDALISDRPYKKAFTHKQATEIMLEGCGSHFDPELIESFKRIHTKFEELSKT